MRILNIEITLESPLHISSEREQETGTRRPFLKTVDGLPYIPASSVKGCLRHEAERLLRSQRIAICNAPSAEYMCQSDQPCPVCQLFGSPWHTSSLLFDDLALANAQIFTQGRNTRIPSPSPRSGVRLNRKRRIAEDGLLFETELFEPGHSWRFIGQIEYDNTDLLVLLYMAARAVNMLGSARSRGLGWSDLTIVDPNTPTTADELEKIWVRWSAKLPQMED